MRVAVMQPYFYPYMGYFRLIAAVDLFILFDCVQFPRRGRVHRTEVPDARGNATWLTMPLARAPRDTRIDALAFASDARSRFAARCAGLRWLTALPAPIAAALRGQMDRPVDYLERNLRAVVRHLDLPASIARSSDFGIPSDIRRGHRVRAVARAAGATHYLNAPGGRALYDPADFSAAGLILEFLAPYRGTRFHMLHSLATEDASMLAREAADWRVEVA